jgi:glycosyltransferase involved in cell wall biosynthesis
MNKPLVTIITPVYNGEDYLCECLESVCAQTYANIEHIVIDDGSNDETLSIVAQYPQIRLIQQSRGGATKARNRGIAQATGSYVVFLDADDILKKDAVAQQVEQLGNLTDKEIGYGYQEVFNGSGASKVTKRAVEQVYESRLVDLIFRNVVTSLSLYPLSALQAVGGFDERMTSRQEWNLNLKLAVAGYHFKYQDIFAYRQRYHDSPDRISNRKLVAETEIQNMKYAYEALTGIDDPRVVDAWATYIWGIGRQFVFAGDNSGARVMFRYAKQISPQGYNRYLSPKYRRLASVFGPIFADKIYAALSPEFRKQRQF